MSLSERDTGYLRAALQDAVVKCSERCLYQSAKWAAELLTSIALNDNRSEPEDSQMTEVPTEGPPPIFMTGNADPEEAILEHREINKYLLAKSLFDCREYDRCAAVFLPDTMLLGVISSLPPKGSPKDPSPKGKGKSKVGSTQSNPSPVGLMPKLSQKSLFLALYAKFMAGEKRKDEDSEMVMGPQDTGKTINKELSTINRFLENWFEERATETGEIQGSQGWLEYLYGIVLAKEKNEEHALSWLIKSVTLYSMNWGCWLEITELLGRIEDLHRISPHLPQNIMSFIFHIHASLELHQSSSALHGQLQEVLGYFPESPFLISCLALLFFHERDFVTAEHHFATILSMHPHRLDSLDHYSNILYVMGARPKLSFLAHLCSSVDKFRPETCVVVGNYYGLLSQHEKAVNYFRRALTLDRSCLAAWTLMGHEYIELKNTHAAIESYRRAVDVNRREYRAWYGLGLAYEMLEMHAYSLWYFKRAVGLRPWDGKLWMAVGSCLQKLGRDYEGIKALKRALSTDSYYDASSGRQFGSRTNGNVGDMDPDVLLQIATMYEHQGEEDEAAEYMQLCIAQEEGLPIVDQDGRRASGMVDEDSGKEGNGTGVTISTSKARMWLARHAMRNSDFDTAMRLATELCQDGVEVEEAKALVREVRARHEAMEDSTLDPPGEIDYSLSP